MLWFFLSYAHANDVEGALVQAFYKTLCTYIGDKVGEAPEAVGYLDKYDLQLGQKWSDELQSAMRRCRTFVPMMSPGYWKSEWCGREWGFFERRCAESKDPPPKLVAPINWVTPFEGGHPEFARALQFAPSQRGLDPDVQALLERQYLKDGMKWFVTRRDLPKFVDSYESIVAQIGDQILGLATKQPLPEYKGATLPDLADIPNRFAPAQPERDSDAVPRENRRAYFAVIAGKALEMRGVRPSANGRYGTAETDDWVPFDSERKSIALIAQQVVSTLDLVHTPVRPAEGWLNQVREAESQHCPSVVLIDPWSAQLYRHRLLELDSALFGNCAVIVVWDFSAPNEGQQRDELATRLHELIRRRRTAYARTPLLCEDVTDPIKLRAALAAALTEIETILAPSRPVLRPVESGTFAQRPVVSAA